MRSSTRAFYDTNIFLLAINTADPDNKACHALLDIDTVTWRIILSAITRGEATLHEYLDQLEQRCALQGVEWVEVPQSAIAATIKQHKTLSAKLKQAGMQSVDIKQVFAAVAGDATLLITRDQDFLDPKDKARPGKKTRGNAVSKLLAGELDLEVLFPKAAQARLTR